MLIEKRIMIDEQYCATMSLDADGGFHVRWRPRPPKALTRSMTDAYLRGRNSLIADALALRPTLPLDALRGADWQ